MKQRKMPLRKCTGCGEMKEKRELIRVVKAPDTKDENGEIIKRANVLGYPFNFLLDKDLNLIKAQPGHLNSDQIKQFVKE